MEPFGSLGVYYFCGDSKGHKMTDQNQSKSLKRSDLGDVFTKEDLPEKIGKNLRQIYDDVLNEPVPDDFLSLLSKADNKSD